MIYSRKEKCMKKILIATRNEDKYKIISKLLSTKYFKNTQFYSLNNIENIVDDKKEEGNIEERSLEKAVNAYKAVNNKYDLIVGVDDGIKIKGEIIENVKEYIKPIINDELLLQGEKVYIVRAFSFINKDGNIKSIVTEIPFQYKKARDKFEILENSYPLGYVLSPIGSKKAAVELSDDESNNYYLKFSQLKLDEIKDFFNE